jgi:hypothetical protein
LSGVLSGQHISQAGNWTGTTKTWSVSPSVDILPFDVTIPATVPLRSKIPEGLMNYHVYIFLQRAEKLRARKEQKGVLKILVGKCEGSTAFGRLTQVVE